MNENINLSNYSLSVRVGDICKPIDMDIFAVMCDRFLYEEIIDIIAQSPSDKIIYSGIRNKTRFFLFINPKEVH